MEWVIWIHLPICEKGSARGMGGGWVGRVGSGLTAQKYLPLVLHDKYFFSPQMLYQWTRLYMQIPNIGVSWCILMSVRSYQVRKSENGASSSDSSNYIYYGDMTKSVIWCDCTWVLYMYICQSLGGDHPCLRYSRAKLDSFLTSPKTAKKRLSWPLTQYYGRGETWHLYVWVALIHTFPMM